MGRRLTIGAAAALAAGSLAVPASQPPARADTATTFVNSRLPSPRFGTAAFTDGATAWVVGGCCHVYDLYGDGGYGGGGGSATVYQPYRKITRVDLASGAVSEAGSLLPCGSWWTTAAYDGQAAYLVVTCDTGTLAIQRYDPAADSLTSTGVGFGRELAGTSAVWTGTYVYFFGGAAVDHERFSDLSDGIWRYDPATNTLAQMGARLPTGTFGASAVWDGRYAYVIGGYDRAGTTSGLSYGWAGSQIGGGTRRILRYDPVTDSVTTMKATLPVSSAGTAAVWDDPNVYIFGACCWYGYFANPTWWLGTPGRVLRFDPAADTISTMAAGIDPPRNYVSAVHDGTNAYAFGGTSGGTTNERMYSSAITRYSPAPAAPGQVAAKPGPGGYQVTVEWTPPPADTHGIPVEGYRIYRALSPTAVTEARSVVSASETSFVDTCPALTCSYQVSAFNADGGSPKSAKAHSVPKPARLP